MRAADPRGLAQLAEPSEPAGPAGRAGACGRAPRLPALRRAAALLILCTAGACLSARFELDRWHGVRTDHFELLTDVNEARAADLARTLELFRAAALALLQLERAADRVPTRFYLFRSEASYRPFQLDRGVVGYFMQPLEGNLLVANVEPGGVRPADVLFHEYTHLLLRNQSAVVPVWFDEGFAEFLSTLSLSENLVELGRAPERRLAELRAAQERGRWMPIERLLTVRSLSELSEREKPEFYAASWLVVHFLYLGHLSSPEFADRADALVAYLERIDDGMSPLDAWRESFGVEPGELDAQLRSYLASGALSVLRYPVDQFAWSERVALRVVGRAELLTQLGELSLALGRPRDARSLLGRAVGIGGDSGRALAGLARASGRASQRETLFARAIAASPGDGVVHGWRALSLTESLERLRAAQPDAPLESEQLAQAQSAAERCLELRPDLPLGYLVHSRLLRLARRGPAQLIPALERAHALLPSHPSTALWLGELYAVTGRREQALRLLRKVAQLAHYEELSARAAVRIESLQAAASQ